MSKKPENWADAAEVKDLMRRNVRAFAMRFFPNGKETGGRWYTGDAKDNPPKAGKKGSLVIDLDGEKQGVWKDFSPDAGLQGGSLIDLWGYRHGVMDFREALKGAREWLVEIGALSAGEGQWRRAQAQRGSNARPAKPQAGLVSEQWHPLGPDTDPDAWRYLTRDRGLPEEALRAGRVGGGTWWFAPLEGEARGWCCLAFPENGEGAALNAKFFANERPQGDKVTRSAKGCAMHLIGMDVAAKRREGGERVLHVAEGEVDWLSLLALGRAAVCVPFGAAVPGQDGRDGRNLWIDNDWDWLQGWEDIVLCYDYDRPGRLAAEHVASRLGMHRTRWVRWDELAGCEPDDDINELYCRDTPLLEKLLAAARGRDPEMLRSPRDFRQEVWEEIFPPGGKLPGLPVPWAEAFPFRFRDGEVTIWMGYNKHGKSVMLSYFLVWFAHLGARCCIASLEIRAAKTLRIMMRQALGVAKPMSAGQPDEDWFDRTLRWMDDWCWVYDYVGEADVEGVLEVFAYARRRYGVRHFVLDSLLKLKVGEEDYEKQKGLVNRLTRFAREEECHVHLVCHARKPPEKRREDVHPPDKYNIRGSGSLSDIVHNVICVWRNKRKAAVVDELRAKGKEDEALKAEKNMEDSLFVIHAQRETGEEPRMRLWFDPISWQFLREYGEMPRRYFTE